MTTHDTNVKGFKLYCSFCKNKPKTNNLALVNVGGRDYLLCEQHSYENQSRDAYIKSWQNHDHRD